MLLESIKKSEPIKRSETAVKVDAISHNAPEKINGVFNDKYIEYQSKDDDNTSVEQNLENIRPYLGNLIVSLRAMKIKFMLSKDSSDIQPIHSKSDNRSYD